MSNKDDLSGGATGEKVSVAHIHILLALDMGNEWLEAESSLAYVI